MREPTLRAHRQAELEAVTENPVRHRFSASLGFEPPSLETFVPTERAGA